MQGTFALNMSCATFLGDASTRASSKILSDIHKEEASSEAAAAVEAGTNDDESVVGAFDSSGGFFNNGGVSGYSDATAFASDTNTAAPSVSGQRALLQHQIGDRCPGTGPTAGSCSGTLRSSGYLLLYCLRLVNLVALLCNELCSHRLCL